MSLSATLFGTDSLIFKATNILGLGIPGLLHKTFGPGEPEAQRLGEISRQTAKEGDPRVIVWGRVRPIGGNIIHSQSPVKRMVKQSSSGGGKGGSKKKTQKVEHVFRTYAIGVCEGPITSFSRIWRNNKLVYDARGNEWGEKNNPVFLKTFRLYLGGWSQMPDPTLQSIWGAGNVPAYRGTAYMVSIDEDLTDQGGMVPQWQFEVERAEGSYLTSRPYAVEAVDGSASMSISMREPPSYGAIEDSQCTTVSILGGTHRELVNVYDNYEPEESESKTISVDGGTFERQKDPLVPYDNHEPEESESQLIAIDGGTFRVSVIVYENYDPEETGAESIGIEGGTHGTI